MSNFCWHCSFFRHQLIKLSVARLSRISFPKFKNLLFAGFPYSTRHSRGAWQTVEPDGDGECFGLKSDRVSATDYLNYKPPRTPVPPRHEQYFHRFKSRFWSPDLPPKSVSYGWLRRFTCRKSLQQLCEGEGQMRWDEHWQMSEVIMNQYCSQFRSWHGFAQMQSVRQRLCTTRIDTEAQDPEDKVNSYYYSRTHPLS
jgi:hypothetical protein